MKTIAITDKAHEKLVSFQAEYAMKKGVKLPLPIVLNKLLKIKDAR